MAPLRQRENGIVAGREESLVQDSRDFEVLDAVSAETFAGSNPEIAV
jgi:hypothetical protein